MKKGYKAGVVAAVLAALSAGCGGGGGSAPAPTVVTVKLSTVAKAGVTPQIKAVGITVLVPEGVSVRTAGATKQTADGVVRYSGWAVFSNLTSQMIPRPLFGNVSTAGSSGRRTVQIGFISPTAFGAGEFATLTCDVPGGVTVSENAFQVTGFQAIGDSGTELATDLTGQFDTPVVTIVR